jgi:hypothetical protein
LKYRNLIIRKVALIPPAFIRCFVIRSILAHSEEIFWSLAEQGEWPTVREMIEHHRDSVDVLAHHSHVLYLACQCGDLDMVDYLLRLPGMTFADLLDLCLVSF